MFDKGKQYKNEISNKAKKIMPKNKKKSSDNGNIKVEGIEVSENSSSVFGKIKRRFDKFMSFKVSRKQLRSTALILFVFFFGILIFRGEIQKLLLNHSELDDSYYLIQVGSYYDEYGEILSSSPPLVRDKSNPVNGNLITSNKYEQLLNRKPFVVTINNHPKARPQYGLGEADIVLEVLAEGGITRYVALFYEKEPEKIGPIRSLRRYMNYFIAEFDSPVIIHEGGASFHDHDTVYVRETDAIKDIWEYNLKSMQTAGSRYRDPEKTASAGYVHALYTGYDLIVSEFEAYGKALGWEDTSSIEELLWKYEDPPDQRGEGGELFINFLDLFSDWSKSGFRYNKLTNSYDRIIGGTEDIDLGTNKQISPKNVIIEWHDYCLANDGYSRIIIDMIGENPVSIYRDGKVFLGTWKKDERTQRTRYYDDTGEEIAINRGQIWKVIAVKSGNQEYSVIEYKEKEAESLDVSY